MGDRQREEPNKILLTVTPFLTKGKLYILALPNFCFLHYDVSIFIYLNTRKRKKKKWMSDKIKTTDYIG